MNLSFEVTEIMLKSYSFDGHYFFTTDNNKYSLYLPVCASLLGLVACTLLTTTLLGEFSYAF